MARTQIAFRLEQDKASQLKKKVNQEGKSLNVVLERLVDAYLENMLTDANKVLTGGDEDAIALLREKISLLEGDLALTRDLLHSTATDKSNLSQTSTNDGWFKGDNTMVTGDNNTPDSPSEGSNSEVLTGVNKVEGEATNTDETGLFPKNQSQLANRLGVSAGSIINHKNKYCDLPDWSKNHDPQGVGWEYDAKSKIFYPLTPTEDRDRD